jgi:hypothetical protein
VLLKPEYYRDPWSESLDQLAYIFFGYTIQSLAKPKARELSCWCWYHLYLATLRKALAYSLVQRGVYEHEFAGSVPYRRVWTQRFAPALLVTATQKWDTVLNATTRTLARTYKLWRHSHISCCMWLHSAQPKLGLPRLALPTSLPYSVQFKPPSSRSRRNPSPVVLLLR